MHTAENEPIQISPADLVGNLRRSNLHGGQGRKRWLWDYRLLDPRSPPPPLQALRSAAFLDEKRGLCVQRYRDLVAHGAKWTGPGPAPADIAGFVVTYILPNGRLFQHVMPAQELREKAGIA